MMGRKKWNLKVRKCTPLGHITETHFLWEDTIFVALPYLFQSMSVNISDPCASDIAQACLYIFPFCQRGAPPTSSTAVYYSCQSTLFNCYLNCF